MGCIVIDICASDRAAVGRIDQSGRNVDGNRSSTKLSSFMGQGARILRWMTIQFVLIVDSSECIESAISYSL
jgi:hypothetical protein